MARSGSDRGILGRRLTRRTALGGALAAGSVAAAYVAVGGSLAGGGAESVTSPAIRGDTDAIADERVKLNHLLRRVGFGLTQEEYQRYQDLGLEKTLDEIIYFTNVDDSEAEAIADEIVVDARNRAAPVLWWLARIANTKRPLQEKMTLFWHGLLTSQISVVRDPTAMVAQNQLFRTHAFDSFPALLRAVTRDPAMMVYLDIAGSRRGAPNENYARELMELFALGEGNYSEEDVREAARAFTGWIVRRDRVDQVAYTLSEPAFRPVFFDGGSKTFLGRTGNFRPDDVIDIITEQPASSAYITRRLFSFFIYADPSEADLAPFVAVYEKNDRRIGAVVEAMLRSDVFYSPRAYRALVKSPVEYAVGALKALGLHRQIGESLEAQRGVRAGGGVLGNMGQVLFEPPNVAGWPGGGAWLNSATMFARLNFINLITGGTTSDFPEGAGRLARRQTGAALPSMPANDLGTVAQALEHYLPLALDDNIPAQARQVLIDYGGGSDAALTPETLRGLVYLVLASPQFHLS